MSTALDEAATALTRMKSEKQSYEAFLRGANQAPSPSQQEAPVSTLAPSSTGHSGAKTNATETRQAPPKSVSHQQVPIDTRAETPPLPARTQSTPSHGGTKTSNGAPGGKQATKSTPQHQPPVDSRAETPPLPAQSQQTQSLQQQASDSMQSLQRLLTQGKCLVIQYGCTVVCHLSSQVCWHS